MILYLLMTINNYTMIKRVINISIYLIFITITNLFADDTQNKTYIIYVKIPLMPEVSLQEIKTRIKIDENIFEYSYDVTSLNHLNLIKTTESEGLVKGSLIEGEYFPNYYESNSIRGDQKRTIKFKYSDSQIKDVVINPPYATDNLTHVTESMISESIDPIMLFFKLTNYQYIKNCDSIFFVFDGKRRYDIILSNKSTDSETLTCKLKQNKIGGYKKKQDKYIDNLTDLIFKKNNKNKFVFHSVEFKDDFFNIIIR